MSSVRTFCFIHIEAAPVFLLASLSAMVDGLQVIFVTGYNDNMRIEPGVRAKIDIIDVNFSLLLGLF